MSDIKYLNLNDAPRISIILVDTGLGKQNYLCVKHGQMVDLLRVWPNEILKGFNIFDLEIVNLKPLVGIKTDLKTFKYKDNYYLAIKHNGSDKFVKLEWNIFRRYYIHTLEVKPNILRIYNATNGKPIKAVQVYE